MARKEKLRLGAFLMIPGHHVASWRYEHSNAEGVLDYGFYRQAAKTAERGKFDMVFLADGYAVHERFRRRWSRRCRCGWSR